MSEEIKPTNEQIEAAMVKKSQQENEHPLDTHAGFFQMYSPVFFNGLERLGKKSLIRVIKLLTVYPLEQEQLKPLNKAEKDLFRIGDQLLVAKYMMYLHTAAEEMVKQEKDKEIGTEEKIP